MTGRSPRRDAGISLVELAVAMGLGTIVLALAGAIFLSLTGNIRTSAGQADRATAAQIARETVDRSLRAADAVPPVSDGTGKVLLDAQAGELTLTTGFSNPAAASALADQLDARVTGSTWAMELRATGLVPRKVRYAFTTGAADCGNSNGVVEQVWPIASITYTAATQTFGVTWSTTSTNRCVLRTDLAPLFTYASDCTGTAPLTPPLSSAALLSTQSVGYALFPGTRSETVGRICLINSGS